MVETIERGRGKKKTLLPNEQLTKQTSFEQNHMADCFASVSIDFTKGVVGFVFN